eukprot:sb/3477545/
MDKVLKKLKGDSRVYRFKEDDRPPSSSGEESPKSKSLLRSILRKKKQPQEKYNPSTSRILTSKPGEMTSAPFHRNSWMVNESKEAAGPQTQGIPRCPAAAKRAAYRM